MSNSKKVVVITGASQGLGAAAVEAYRETLKSPNTEAAWKRWPCLSRQLGVELALDQPA